jgi:hypothetical protein
VDTHPSGAGKAVYATRFPEFVHANCKDPTNAIGPVPESPRGPRYGLSHPDMMPVIEPRFPSNLCAGPCHKEFKPGDRIFTAYIVAGTAKDPQSGHINAVASPNFECYHKNCADPSDQLGSGIIISSS